MPEVREFLRVVDWAREEKRLDEIRQGVKAGALPPANVGPRQDPEDAVRLKFPEAAGVYGALASMERDPSDAAKKVTEFASKQGLNYINFLDAKNQLQSAYGGIESIPTTIIIDRQGTIKEVIIGSQDFFSFTSSLNKVLKQ